MLAEPHGDCVRLVTKVTWRRWGFVGQCFTPPCCPAPGERCPCGPLQLTVPGSAHLVTCPYNRSNQLIDTSLLVRN